MANSFEKLKKYRTEIIIVSLALITRGIFFVAYLLKLGDAGLNYGDGGIYLRIAENLIKHGSFSIMDSAPFLPDSYIAPGYPFLLAFFKIFTNQLWPVGLLQVILGGVTAFFVYRLGGLWGKRIGLIAALLFALEPTMAFWAPLILTETVFTFLFVLAIYWFVFSVKCSLPRYYFLSAFILGLAALVRPSAQYVFYLLVLFGAVRIFSKDWKKRLIYLLIFAAIFNATISPWLIRNYEAWGKVKLSSAGWYLLSVVNTTEYIKFWKYFPPEEITAIPARQPCGENETADWNFDCEDQYGDYVKAVWRANPPAAIAVHLVGLAPFFLGDGYMNILRTFWPEIKQPSVLFGARNLAGLPSVPFKLTDIYALVFWIGKFFWVIIYSMMLYGIIIFLRDKEKLLWILLFLGIIAAIALPAGAISYARYRMPVNYLIFLIFAFGLDRLLKKYGRGKS